VGASNCERRSRRITLRASDAFGGRKAAAGPIRSPMAMARRAPALPRSSTLKNATWWSRRSADDVRQAERRALGFPTATWCPGGGEGARTCGKFHRLVCLASIRSATWRAAPSSQRSEPDRVGQVRHSVAGAADGSCGRLLLWRYLVGASPRARRHGRGARPRRARRLLVGILHGFRSVRAGTAARRAV